MAEIFSTVGSAVGVVSLGIQISKGLVWFIEHAKDANDSVSQIQNQMDQLSSILEALESAIDKLQATDSKKATQAGVLACAGALEKIRTKLASVNGPKPSKKLSLKERLMFPFRQGKLSQLKEVLESVQGNLDTALMVLQIEERNLATEDIKLRITQQSQLTQESTRLLLVKQQAHNDQSTLDLLDKTRLIYSNLYSTTETVGRIHMDIDSVQSTLSPIAASVSQLSDTIPVALSRLEAKIDDLSPRSLSSKAINDDIQDLHHLSRRLENDRPKHDAKRRQARKSCTCHGQSRTIVYLQWPIQLSRTLRKVHNSTCPYAIEDDVAELNVRFTMCSLALKRKTQLALALSNGAGSMSVKPALETYRVVDERSPAFRLLASFGRRIGPEPDPLAWEKPARDLLKLFNTKRASPHDRLPDGQTLLHYFFSSLKTYELNKGEYWTSNHYYMARRMLDYMPREALERDDGGFTCVDYGVRATTSWGGEEKLVTNFIGHGIPVTILRHVSLIRWDLARMGFPAQKFDEDTLDCSDRAKAVLLRSEARLDAILADEEYARNSSEDGYSLYKMATVAGWRRGCEMILERGIKFDVGATGYTLLELAMHHRHLDVVRFWLEVRPTLDDEALESVGSLENAVVAASGEPSFVDVAVSALVTQRRQLQYLAESHLSSEYYVPISDGLLDVHAREVFDALRERGIPVHSSLRPSTSCIYHLITPIPYVLDSLYKAGFHDTTAPDAKSASKIKISPLLFLLTTEGPLRQYEKSTIDWFRKRGATLDERWPNSSLTLLHFIGWACGNAFSKNLSRRRIMPQKAWFEDRNCADGCRCACSSSGCVFITMVCKGVAYVPRDRLPTEVERLQRRIWREWDDRMGALAEWITPAIKNGQNRWLVTEFIRLVVFTKLGVRHTCCDPGRAMHNHTPRFHPVLEWEGGYDDGSLLEVFQRLVRKLDGMYDGYVVAVGNLQKFLAFEILPRVEQELERLREEDLRLFARGRREMGIVMEIEGSEDEDEDEEETSGSESEDSDASDWDDDDDEEED